MVALEVLVRGPDLVALGELVPVFELLTEPVVVLDIPEVFDLKGLLVAVLDENCVIVDCGEELDDFDIADDRVDVFVDVPVFVERPETVCTKLGCGVCDQALVRVDVLVDTAVKVGCAAASTKPRLLIKSGGVEPTIPINNNNRVQRIFLYRPSIFIFRLYHSRLPS